MLILAAVTINIVINGGLIGYARNAREAQESEQAKEKEEMLKAEYEMAKLTGGTEANTYDEYLLEQTYGVHIGDTINYNFLKSGQETSVTVNTEETGYYTETTHNEETGKDEPVNINQTFTLPTENNLTWKVIGIENGHILISPTDVIGVTDSNPNGQQLRLKGKNGVTNGVNVLNKISALYGHGNGAEETMYTYGSTKSGARSITVEDINNLTGYDVKGDSRYEKKWQYKLVADAETEGQNKVQYSEDNGTTWNDCVDMMDNKIRNFEYYKNGNWGKLTEVGDTVELEDTGYIYYLTADQKGLVYIENKGFWLASPYTGCNTSNAHFGLRHVGDNGMDAFVYGYNLYDSRSRAGSGVLDVRPVVSLRSDIQLTETPPGSGVWNITGTN